MTALSATSLSVEYPGAKRRTTRRVLRDVSFQVAEGRTLGLVGESGSGKSTLARAVLGLVPLAAGEITFLGTRVDHLRGSARRRAAGGLQVVQQDPYGSLNPLHTVGDIIAEPIRRRRSQTHARVAELLERVGLPASASHRFPAQFSGGQRQRIAIARALAGEPRVIICDEAVSALDLTTQARILDLLIDLQRERGLAYLFISHDLDVIRHVSHDVAVLEDGRIVESGPAGIVTDHPHHAYTRRLLAASPVLDVAEQQRRRRARRAAERQDADERG